jgi:hypothetical protein
MVTTRSTRRARGVVVIEAVPVISVAICEPTFGFFDSLLSLLQF